MCTNHVVKWSVREQEHNEASSKMFFFMLFKYISRNRSPKFNFIQENDGALLGMPNISLFLELKVHLYAPINIHITQIRYVTFMKPK